MSAALNAAQRAYVRRAARASSQPDESAHGELNVVPFLDIVTNVMMFILATIATAFTAQITLRPPGSLVPHPAPPSSAVTVHVLPEGYLVAVDDAFVNPDCTSTGPAAVTVPLAAGRHDAPALSHCLLTLRAAPAFHDALSNQRVVQVSARGEIAYAVLIGALDATRESAPGAADLFPEPSLGTVR